MPPPSEPGNQAATNALDALISGLTQRGRPDINTLTVGMPNSWKRSRSSSAASGAKSTDNRSPWNSA